MTEDFTKVMTEVPTLESKDIADAVLYALSTPEHVQVRVAILSFVHHELFYFNRKFQVHELTIKPIGEM